MTGPRSPSSLHGATGCPGESCDGGCAELDPASDQIRTEVAANAAAGVRGGIAIARPDRAAPVGTPVVEYTSPRDVKIAIARQAIESCLLDDDQIAPGHETPFVDSTMVVFTVACPTWERGADLEAEVHKALAPHDLPSYAKRTLERGETRVEIRVVVGAVDREPAGAL